jgi:hypothetical protein
MHLFSMEDLKLFSRDKTKLRQSLTIVYIFSDDIWMDLDLHKCATAVFMFGNLTKIQNIILYIHGAWQDL